MTDPRRLAHDMRNCLNALRLNAQCLPLCDGDELFDSINAMITASDEMLTLLDQAAQLPDSPDSPRQDSNL